MFCTLTLLLIGALEDCPVYHRWLVEDAQQRYRVSHSPVENMATALLAGCPDGIVIVADPTDLADPMGMGVVERVRSHLTPQSPPIFLLVEAAQELAAVDALQQGITDYLVKDGLTPLRLQTTLWQGITAVQCRQQRQQAEQQLAAFQHEVNWMRQVFDAIPSSLFVKNREGAYMLINQTGARLFGKTPQQIVGLRDADFVTDAEIVSRFAAQDQQIMATGETGIFPDKVVWDEAGEPHWYQTVISPFWDAAGQIQGVIGNSVEVTERKQAEDALRQSEAIQRAILAAIPDTLIRIHRNGQRLSVLNADRVRLAQPISDILTKLGTGGLPPDLAAERMAYVQAALDTGEPQVCEYDIETQGERRTEEARIVACGPDEVLAIIRDVTEARQVEAHLRHSQKLYRTLVDGFPNGAVLLFDRHLRYHVAGGIGLEQWGLTREQVEHHYPQSVFPPKACQTIEPLHRQALAGDAVAAEITVENRTYLTHHIPIRDGAGQIEFGVALVQDITAQKQAAQALQSSQSILRGVLDTIPLGVFWQDREGHFLGCNRQMALDAGFDSPAALIGLTDFDMPWREEAPLYQAERQQVMLTGMPQLNVEAPMTLCNQQQRWVRSSKLPLRNALGEIIGLLSTYEDVTERKQMFAQLRRIGKAIDCAGDGIAIADLEGNPIYLNPAMLRMFGYHQESLLSTISGEENHLRQSLLTQIRQGQSWSGEIVLPSRSGDQLNILLRADAIRDVDESILGLVAVHTDITAYKQATNALRESEMRLRTVIANTPVIVYALDAEGRFTLSEGRGLKRLGLAPQELVGLSVFEVYADYPELLDRLRQILAGHSPESSWLVHLEGAVYDNRVTLLHDALGQMTGLIGIATDVTERYRAEQALQELNQQLEARVQARTRELMQANAALEKATQLKNEFLANMSHELRTPLNAVIGLAEGLQEQIFGPVNREQQKAIATIERSGCHLLDLINDILDVSKIESGKLELFRQPTSLPQLFEASLTLIQPTATHKGITLTTHIAPGLDRVDVDERRLRQLLVNLLSNAVKFTPPGGDVTLTAALEQNPEEAASPCLVLQVQDTGVGIAPEEQTRLFQPFVQLDSSLSRRHGGTGLGLVLVKRIAELHGGSIDLISTVGAGSCFRVTIPISPLALGSILPSEPLAAPSLGPSLADLSTQVANCHPLILVAEDNETNIETIAEFLRFKGYRVIFARNGLETLQQALQHQPDLILMDIQMPLMDGLEAAQKIRCEPPLQAIPIIALTALAMPGDRQRCLDAGMNDYIVKPVSLQQLTRTLADYLPPNPEA